MRNNIQAKISGNQQKLLQVMFKLKLEISINEKLMKVIKYQINNRITVYSGIWDIVLTKYVSMVHIF